MPILPTTTSPVVARIKSRDVRRNRSMPPSDVIPVLGYPDVPEAVAWLSGAFGFVERWRVGNHRAQLWVGDGAIAVTEGARAGGNASVMVRVEDVDSHHERARAHGARVEDEPADYPYGERQYTAVDHAGHRWTFSQTIADVAPEDWGGTSGRLDR
jgi:uncharacterized glyoxalase superfamily protein PhnB